MPSTKSLKQRIKSVKNTSQITKAMEAVSATKMRRSQESALGARPYAVAGFEMLENLLMRTPNIPALLEIRPVATSALLIITSDKGLAGAFNTNVLKKAEVWISEKKSLGMPYAVVTVGKKAKDYLQHRDVALEKSFFGFGDFSTPEDTLPVAELMLGGFINKQWDEVEAVYTNFRTTLVQEAVLRKILPVTKEGLVEIIKGIAPEHGRFSKNVSEETPLHRYNYEYKFEPSPDEILTVLIPQLLRISIHHLILESNASEHSARMVAMKNASDNAKDLIGNLNLVYNKVRQANITKELIEITAGMEALR